VNFSEVLKIPIKDPVLETN